LSQNLHLAFIDSFLIRVDVLGGIPFTLYQHRYMLNELEPQDWRALLGASERLTDLSDVRRWRLDRCQEPTTRLSHTMRLFRNRESTVPQDLFYGLLGLLDSDECPSPLVPDNRLTFDQVSWRYARYLIEATKDWSIIETEGRHLTDCPTWVPDIRFGKLVHRDPAVLPVTTRTVSTSSDHQILYVEGVQIGKVVNCSCRNCPCEPSESTKLSHIGNDLSYIRDTFLATASRITGQEPHPVFYRWLHTSFMIEGAGDIAFRDNCVSMNGLVTKPTELQHTMRKRMHEEFPHESFDEAWPLFRNMFSSEMQVFSKIAGLASSKYCLLETGDIVRCDVHKSTHHTLGDCAWLSRAV
jgi:hypothetical protein